MLENKGKYNIDDLVNSLLMERQPEMPLTAPELDVIEENVPDNPDILDIPEGFSVEAEEEPEDSPSQLLDFDALEEASVIMVETETAVKDAAPHLVEELTPVIDIPKADVLPREEKMKVAEVPLEEPAMSAEPTKSSNSRVFSSISTCNAAWCFSISLRTNSLLLLYVALK